MELIPLQIILYTIVLFFLAHAYSQVNIQEQQILLNLNQQWQNPPALTHWTSSNTSHCSWPEIHCSNNSVTGISLNNTNITLPIPSFICDLENLASIDFQNNSIPGDFPTVLYNCSKLEYLDLSINDFVGEVPNDIDRLTNLQFLNLGTNNFSGEIPGSIGGLKELRILYLPENLFTGTYPAEIGNLFNLEELWLSYNTHMSPSNLPSNFTQLKRLRNLWMLETNLIGEIPNSIGNMVALESLDLSTNNLTGPIPDSMFMLKNLTTLYIFKNSLIGEIPRVVGALNLGVIDLSENNLTGTIPADFGKLEKLTGLALFMNQLSGHIPANIGRLPALMDVRLFSNNFTGDLPADFGRFSPLREFQVASNKLTGRLPENLCAGGVLLGVVAFDNQLEGELPVSLGNCSSLLVVIINNNKFEGKIPDGLWTSVDLQSLTINDNLFTGELPDRLGSNLSRLEIGNNRFSGKIPVEVSLWKNLVVFEASNNLLNGSIPTALTALTMLSTLLLDMNQFSGELPSEIISWNSISTLNLSRNHFSGEIPADFGVLPKLNELDLSENELSGEIPPELGLLTFTFLNLSSNNFVGKIPREFENAAYADSFLDNPGLCAATSSLNLSLCGSEPRISSKKISSRLLALLIAVAAVGLVLTLLLSFFAVRVYRKKNQGLDPTWKLISFQKLNFTELNILSGLTENNVIGSGGSGKVYRVAVSRLGNVVAVKRILSNRKADYKLEKEFNAEVQILSTLRHFNIVKLLCCLSSENSKLIVYDYMENGSLDMWLHRKKGLSIVQGSGPSIFLDWPKRFHIALGACQGLCYMHHDSWPPIIHRDVKSSNILLDSHFNAKVADFGLAKTLIKQEHPATMSTVAGSLGYIAPENAYTTRMNEKIDVYSFGVVLLELATGREASEGDEETCLAEWAWRYQQEGNSITEALDKEIMEPCYLEEMTTVFKLGTICTGTMPSSRPSMKEVLQILTRCRNPYVFGVKNAGSYDESPLLRNSEKENDDSTSTSDSDNYV